MAFFTDHASKELYKARRYNRRLSFMQLTIDNYEELKSKFLDREIEEGQQRLLAVVNEVLRDADIMALYKDNIYHTVHLVLYQVQDCIHMLDILLNQEHIHKDIF